MANRSLRVGVPRARLLTGSVIAGMVAASVWMIFSYAPTEVTMGDVQRIVYLHVSVAWCGLAAGIAMAVCGTTYLVRRQITWDHSSRAAGEIGWLCTTLTLVTGSLWAHEAWGTWWTWEPRLTSMLVLWMVYAGIFLVRAGVDDPHRRARTSAVLAIVGACDIPLVLMATRLYRGIHPITPEMDPRMRIVLLVSVVSFTALFAYLALGRRRQLELLDRAIEHEDRLAEITVAEFH
jgi:heme exporter protein C